MKKQLLLFTAFIMSLISTFASSKNDGLLVIPYGSKAKIIYHLKYGTYDLQSDEKVFIKGAYSQVKNGKQLISSKSYTSAKYQEQRWSDQLGTGKKYVITLIQAGLPRMEQVFYVYPGHDFFLTEVQLSGSKLSSNYIAPLLSQHASIHAKGDNRNLFVPFDNDTFIRYDAKSTLKEVDNTSSEVGALYDNNSITGYPRFFGTYRLENRCKDERQGRSIVGISNIWRLY